MLTHKASNPMQHVTLSHLHVSEGQQLMATLKEKKNPNPTKQQKSNNQKSTTSRGEV